MNNFKSLKSGMPVTLNGLSIFCSSGTLIEQADRDGLE